MRGAVAALGLLVAAAAVAHADDTVRTHAELSAFLVAPAARAAKAHDVARAIPIYRALVLARGSDGAEGKALAQLVADAGDDSKLALVPDTADARAAVAAAKRERAAKHPADARLLLQLAYALAPEAPGVLAELAAALPDDTARDDLYRADLAARPFGANADAARKRLGASQLATLTLASSLPCAQVWLNGEKVSGKLPAQILVPSGTYKGLCFEPRYEMALFAYASVDAGDVAHMTFTWAIVVNALQHPLGRIAVENAQAPGVMVDLGITSPEVGVAVPADHHALRVVLTDDSGQRREARSVQLAPGQRVVIQW